MSRASFFGGELEKKVRPSKKFNKREKQAKKHDNIEFVPHFYVFIQTHNKHMQEHFCLSQNYIIFYFVSSSFK